MKHWKHLLIFTALMASLAVTPAHALEYDIGAPDDYLFGRPTSDETFYEQAPAKAPQQLPEGLSRQINSLIQRSFLCS